jgi:hypothetical protein
MVSQNPVILQPPLKQYINVCDFKGLKLFMLLGIMGEIHHIFAFGSVRTG